MNKKWEYVKIDDAEVQKIASENNIPTILSKILYTRGFRHHDEIQNFLNPRIDCLYDPFLLNDINYAIDRIILARDRKEKVTIYGDYDVDGITSVAVLVKFLCSIGIEATTYLPNRLEEGYGLNNEAIKHIFEDGTSLIITVDCGVSGFDEVEFAKSLKMDVIITDHHECPETLPNAVAVIDPKRRDNMYPWPYLAGVGVTFKLIQAISLRLNLDRKAYLKYIDIVSLGTVADIVPLRDENRIIVYFGIILMKQTKNIGLRELLKVTGYSKIDSSAISFGLAPRINACGRMGCARLALDLLLTDDENKAHDIALKLNDMNKERQEIEKKILNEAIEKIENEKLYKNSVIVVSKEHWHHGVIGIVSSKITDMYYKPSILISIENGKGKGSGRSIEGLDLHDALTQCSDLLTKFGGHEMAVGITIDENNIEAFASKLNEYADRKNIDAFVPTVFVDTEITTENISIDTVKQLEMLEPHGEANPPPVFVYKNIKVDGIRTLSNEKHLKLTLKDGGYITDAIGFNMGEKRHSIKIGDKVDVLNTIEINCFNNVEKVQLNIKDVKKSL